MAGNKHDLSQVVPAFEEQNFQDDLLADFDDDLLGDDFELDVENLNLEGDLLELDFKIKPKNAESGQMQRMDS